MPRRRISRTASWSHCSRFGAHGQLSFPAWATDHRFAGDPQANQATAQTAYADGATVLNTLPTIVTLALTSRCNAKVACVICDRNTRPASADADLDAQVIEAARPLLASARYVMLHCGGEPLLSPLFGAVTSLTAAPTVVGFATNAMLLTKAMARAILARQTDTQFIVSLDASTPAVYRIMRPSFDFRTVTRNVTEYLKMAKRQGRSNNLVILNMTVCETNLEDVPGLVDLAVKMGASGVKYNHLNPG